MNLGTKASRGYAMAALLVAMAVMAIGLSVALPAWSHMIRREKEEEMIFRADQYARAINMYQRKYANASPQNLDVLIKERFLRKKFKDPLSPDKDGEFQMLSPQQSVAPGPPSRSSGSGPESNTSGCGPSRGSGTGTGASTGVPAGGSFGSKTSAGICGVTSKNSGQSIHEYKGKTRYNEWLFTGIEYVPHGGGASGAAGAQPGAPMQPGVPPRGGFGSQRGDSQRGGRGGFPPPDRGTTFMPAPGPGGSR